MPRRVLFENALRVGSAEDGTVDSGQWQNGSRPGGQTLLLVSGWGGQ